MDVDVNCLPGKLICKIFSELPPLMLVDVIPLVCKRWYGLSKRQESWRNCDIVISDTASKKELDQLVRLASGAPYLNYVDFTKVNDLGPEVKAIVSALLKVPKTVRSLCAFGSSTVAMRELTRKMLKAWASTLREVTIPLPRPATISKDYRVSMCTILTRISEIRKLQKLCFILHGVPDFDYTGQLSKGFSSLKKFSVLSEDYGCLSSIKCNRFIFDILENNKKQLVEVNITEVCHPIDKFKVALASCHNLVSCKVPLEILSVVKNMSQLQSLEVYFMPLDELKIAKSWRELRHFIGTSSVIEEITELFLTEPPLHRNPCKIRPYYIDVCLAVLARKIKRVKNFRLLNVKWMSDLNLKLFFSNLINANSICVIDSLDASPFSKCHIEMLSASKYLKLLKIVNLKVPSVCVAEEIQESIQNLKSQQPLLQTDFNIIVVDQSASLKTINNTAPSLNYYNCYHDEEDFIIYGLLMRIFS
ncbi:F-box/WD repeat-containing protein mec-15 [Frankliniella fusca]|uniref:F-box/WD repeat-containing protein mec-15 n=1 Tax=Frankliniella fusca TaxID=407009 RepID=A0AAE1I1Y8_9NEOP|nr:F-box/WD repeat-containing protein mec-15 [Frankliniella fusca]